MSSSVRRSNAGGGVGVAGSSAAKGRSRALVTELPDTPPRPAAAQRTPAHISLSHTPAKPPRVTAPAASPAASGQSISLLVGAGSKRQAGGDSDFALAATIDRRRGPIKRLTAPVSTLYCTECHDVITSAFCRNPTCPGNPDFTLIG